MTPSVTPLQPGTIICCMANFEAKMSEPDPPAWTSAAAMHLQLVDEITRLSRIHIDLAAALERQTKHFAATFERQTGLIAQLQVDLGVVTRETTRNAETLFDRAVTRIDAFEHEHRGRGQLHSDLMWYPTWSATAPVLGDPLISVIMPTRDRRTLLERALSSLQQQTYENWEAIVVDDASSDDTAAFVRSLATSDVRIRLIQSDGSGCAAARQRALLAANGQVVTYLDDDNLMGGGWLRAVAEFFGRNRAVDVVYGAQLRLEDDSGSSGSQPFVLFEPYDEVRLAESNFIDAGVIAHRAGLSVQHAAGVRGVDDWHFMLDLAALTTPWPLPVVASIYLTMSPDRDSQRPDHHVSEESTRSLSAHIRLLDDRFVDAALQSTRSGASYQLGSPVPTTTRLDGEVLLFILIALARRHSRPLRVVDWGADERAVAIVEFLTRAGLETNWLSFRSSPAQDGSLQPGTLLNRRESSVGQEMADKFVSNPLTSVDLPCCGAADGSDSLENRMEEPACVRSVRNLGVSFDVVLIDSQVGCLPTEVACSVVGPDGLVLVQADDETTSPDFRAFASSARIGHRLWIAACDETDFARIVPIRGLIEGRESARTYRGAGQH